MLTVQHPLLVSPFFAFLLSPLRETAPRHYHLLSPAAAVRAVVIVITVHSEMLTVFTQLALCLMLVS